MRTTLAAALLAVASGTTACRQSPAAKTAETGPRGALQHIMTLRAAQRYTELQRWIVPEQATQVADFLISLDAFVRANDRLLDAIRRDVPIGVSDRVDQAYITDALGIFARRVELLDEHVAGDDATVSVIVNDLLPPQTANLRRIDGRWRYDPGPGFSPYLIQAFDALARGLEQVAQEVQDDRIRAEDLVRDPERLIRRVQGALQPGVSLLSKARAAAVGDAPP